MTLAYLSSPYTHDDPKVAKQRYEDTMAMCAHLVRQNYFVISPIVHWHPVALRHKLPTDYAFWKEYNHELIRRCDIFFILRLEGWKQSKGVMDEMKLANELNKLIDFLTPI